MVAERDAGGQGAEGSKLKEFKNLKLIGKGSFGRVHRAVRISDDKEYALKELNMKSMSKKEREDSVNEVRILSSSFKNPLVIRYYDAFMEGDSLWIVTEFAKGGDIGAKIKRHRQRKEYISEDLIWAFFIQVCQGLKLLHDSNILHRDIKSQNIFIIGPRAVKIGDFGIAKATKSGMARTQIGTPYYMSPEIWKNLPYDKKSDIWSLGVVLYEMTALKHPFEAQNERSLYAKIMKGSLEPLPRGYSSELQSVVRMCLNVDADRRPSIDDLLGLPIVRKRMHDMPSVSDQEPITSRDKIKLVDTIQVPKLLHQLQGLLPGSKYDDDLSARSLDPPISASEPNSSRRWRAERRKGSDRGAQVAQSVDSAYDDLISERYRKANKAYERMCEPFEAKMPGQIQRAGSDRDYLRGRNDDRGRLPSISSHSQMSAVPSNINSAMQSKNPMNDPRRMQGAISGLPSAAPTDRLPQISSRVQQYSNRNIISHDYGPSNFEFNNPYNRRR
mmetsp:Transcript_27337/g.42720  ORF Transcript_27337/g.42720 Transcript_27337/m.42720 type:complete len:501 (+) Transcript_27337:825-2327(+)|eukprot:CAMPEP_0184298260 /NCGR_PEP_ID=MMETSP1049-20130417/9085_1 /TAXON_ID=77928 /ORGANISM="Proteomonas sulcata, Strain CCMP704" /LENGTH=500 /DNA_ID=CAMNT_0026608331 /DNA_START=35 /DNA_END=1537 /DNA_ORIENTATION=+